MSNKIKNNFYLLIFLISIFSISSALYIEYILKVPACKLCLYQRIPYMISLIFCFFGYFFSGKKFWAFVLFLTFLSNMLLSGYHLGIENNIFLEFSGCTNENLNIIDKNDLLKNLNNFLPSCKDVNFRILGLSLATINFVLSIVLIIITVKYLRYVKN